ncbi:MAG TPA: hypothetical protein VFV33_03460, partial [Gemmatimonadaceae bacterium]|nr:hypothetical protein [Gemmatimonadaceae bacterium]
GFAVVPSRTWSTAMSSLTIPLLALTSAALATLAVVIPVRPSAAQQARPTASSPRQDAVRARPSVRPMARPAPGEPSLDVVRKATERFRDVRVALAEGYIRDPGNICDNAEIMGRPAELGAMGIHFFRPDLLGITGPPSPRVNGTGTHTDFNQPSILIYEPQRDGSLALVAVENLVFIKAWEQAGHTAPPSFHGVPWDRMQDDPATAVDEAHMFEPHYDRHVWLYRDNPKGIFAQFNPKVSCRYHTQQGGHAH